LIVLHGSNPLPSSGASLLRVGVLGGAAVGVLGATVAAAAVVFVVVVMVVSVVMVVVVVGVVVLAHLSTASYSSQRGSFRVRPRSFQPADKYLQDFAAIL